MGGDVYAHYAQCLAHARSTMCCIRLVHNTYIHIAHPRSRYTVSVGLAQARPNYKFNTGNYLLYHTPVLLLLLLLCQPHTSPPSLLASHDRPSLNWREPVCPAPLPHSSSLSLRTILARFACPALALALPLPLPFPSSSSSLLKL